MLFTQILTADFNNIKMTFQYDVQVSTYYDILFMTFSNGNLVVNLSVMCCGLFKFIFLSFKLTIIHIEENKI